MILITGAGGKTGLALTRALSRRGAQVRALVRRPDQVDVLTAAGASEIITGDLRAAQTLSRAAAGARAVYHICPNMTPDEVEITRMSVDAARAAGVQHFVYHSVLHPQVEDMPHHWNKMRAEEMLFKSGMCFTILQPAAYMQNILAYWESITQQGIYAVPYAVETRLGMVDLQDVAEAAASVCSAADPSQHAGAIYELAGSEALTQAQVAEILARVLQRPVRAESIPRDTWEQRVRAGGMADFAVNTLLKMFVYYERYGFWGNPRTLTCLLGRPPAAFQEFLERQLRE